MIKFISVATAVLILSSGGLCFSDNSCQLSDIFYTCLEKASGVSTEIADCHYNETQFHDKKLNNAYKQLMSEYSEELRLILRDVQRAWINYRDLKCGFFMDVDSGSLGKMNTQSCFTVETARRAHELERLIGYY